MRLARLQARPPQMQVPIPKELQPHIPRLRQKLRKMRIGD
jgi:hypothetical protein